jgi:hypothetical protein
MRVAEVAAGGAPEAGDVPWGLGDLACHWGVAYTALAKRAQRGSPPMPPAAGHLMAVTSVSPGPAYWWRSAVLAWDAEHGSPRMRGYTRAPPEHVARRRARVMRLRAKGLTFPQIAAQEAREEGLATPRLPSVVRMDMVRGSERAHARKARKSAGGAHEQG